MTDSCLPFSHASVRPIDRAQACDFIAKHHYTGNGGRNASSIGLFEKNSLVGVAAFATPVSKDAAACVFGPEYHSRARDLQRFVLTDEMPTNSESWFIKRALASYKKKFPHVWAVTSFADSTEGHVGTIYQATNAVYAGMTRKRIQYRDEAGILHSDRYGGKRVNLAEAAERGWSPEMRQGKYRYLYLLPDDKRHGRLLRRLVRWIRQPYPHR